MTTDQRHTLSPRSPDNLEPLLFFGRECTFIVTAKPLQCPGCGEARFFFINRDGRTHCAECDLKKAANVPFDPRDPWSYLGGA